MEKLIDFNSFPLNIMIGDMLIDKTTNKNIVFATKDYGFDNDTSITLDKIKSNEVSFEPRVKKNAENKLKRTRDNAEVFTPAWICNRMNNHCDEQWFGKTNVFNSEVKNGWKTNTTNVEFNDKKWEDYVLSKRLEITCGEAPYIVSRYDSSTGEFIDVENRIGILDRKIRVINEHVFDEKEWFEWVYKAYKSVYGFEFQGDNLLIARTNLLLSFNEYVENKWKRNASDEELKKIANIICWNIWQMDANTFTVPFAPYNENVQMSLFDSFEDNNTQSKECNIFDWNLNKEIKFKNTMRGSK